MSKYISQDEFVSVCYECAFNIPDIVAALRSRYPDRDFRPYRVENRLRDFRAKGILPLDSGNSVSAGELLKSSSTLYDSDGKIKLQWVKSDLDKQAALSNFETAVDAVLEKLSETPIPIIVPPTFQLDDLMSVYTIGDAHIGMLAWAPESGEDNDLQIAYDRHIAAMQMLVAQSNPSTEAFIVDVGDFFHSDTAENRTAASGHSLDVDGRYAKVLEFGLTLTTKLIELALQKHQVVHWRSAIGNHNEHAAIMMNKFVRAFYRNEPRVIVHDSPSTLLYHQFGLNLIGITHGHRIKPDRLGEVMSVDCEDIWSSTKFRYWYTGHVHHQSIKEYPSCVVETFRTLASKDAWHAASGYRSKQDMKCITLHKQFGEVSRNIVSLAQIHYST